MSVELLTSEVNKLSDSLTFWNKVVIFFVFFTAFIAFLYFVASYVAHRKAIHLNKANGELIKRKDKEQALQIEKIKRDSAERIAKVEAEANKKIALLNADAEKAKEGLAIANQRAAVANEKAETEQLERMQLEAEIAPRIVEQMQSAIDLSQFQGINVIIESVAESEPWRMAGQIAWILSTAKWNVLPGMKRFLDTTHFFDGVTIEVNTSVRVYGDKSREAAEALMKVFEKNRIAGAVRPAHPKLPLNAIKIRVGLKPTEYFDRNREGIQIGKTKWTVSRNTLYK